MFKRAAEILQARHHVTEMDAYEMLVQEAVDAGTSVREAAVAVLAGSPSPADLTSPRLRESASP